ncbi:MAG: lipid-A-disaccharide synthase, partial [Proteobacteria bacterium]|nr:lipid-A-disaccharide synthase [Pseudomonadota bacterium]
LPDFNLRLAKNLKKLGVPVVYYISPQVWAWRKGRVKKIKQYVDKMLVVFPFEKDFYEKEGIDVEFVGHPLLERIEPRKRYRDQAVIQKTPRIAILPGSRKSELRYHAPVLRKLIVKLKQTYPGCEIKVPLASTLSKEMITKALNIEPAQVALQSWDTLDWADVAVVASGTATLETALIGTPFCLFYKVSSSSAWLFRNWIKYRGFLGMPNILLKRLVVKECFQENATSEKIFAEVKHLINSGPSRLNMVSSLLTCRQILGGKGASARAARVVTERL